MINEEDVKPDLLFVGAGSIGLLTAIQTKLLAPTQKILMLEQNKTYTGNHTLSVQSYVYNHAHLNERLQNILKGPGSNRSVNTWTIDGELKKYATELGIAFDTIWVTNQLTPNIMILASDQQALPAYNDLNLGVEDCFVIFNNLIYFANTKDNTLTNIAKSEQDVKDIKYITKKIRSLTSIELNKVISANELKALFLQIKSFDQQQIFYTLISILISIQTGTTIVHPENLRTLFPEAHTIVGADGTCSIIRQTFFNNEKSTSETCQYIVEVKYCVNNPTRPVDGSDFTSGLSQINHFVHEFVGERSDYSTPISLFFFVDKKTHDEILAMGGTPGNPLQLNAIDDRNSCIAKLANSIHPWIAYRHALFGDAIKPETVKIVAIAQSKNAIVHHTNESKQSTRYLLVGGAFLGAPFQDSYGHSATEAARLITSNPDETPLCEQAYNSFMQQLVKNAMKRAQTKNGQANASALLNNAPAPLGALKNARITPPSFLRRYGRRLTSSIAGFLVLASIFSAIALTVLTTWPLWVLIGGSFLAAAALVLTFNVILIIATGITRWVKSNNQQDFEVQPEEALRSNDIKPNQPEQNMDPDTDHDNALHQIITCSSNGNQPRTGSLSDAFGQQGFFPSAPTYNKDLDLRNSSIENTGPGQ